MAARSPLWFAGVCDNLGQKIARWCANYERGEVCRTRKYLNYAGIVQDIPTQYLHIIPFKPAEVDHLVRIVEALRPKQAGLLDMLRITQRDLKKYALRPGGQYAAPMPYFKSDVQEMLDALKEARDGIGAAGLEEHVQKQQQAGKFLWEV